MYIHLQKASGLIQIFLITENFKRITFWLKTECISGFYLLAGIIITKTSFLKNRKPHNTRKWYLNKDNKTILSSVGTYYLKKLSATIFSMVFFVCFSLHDYTSERKFVPFSAIGTVVHYVQKSINVFSFGVRKHPRALHFPQSSQWNFYLALISWPSLGMCENAVY